MKTQNIIQPLFFLLPSAILIGFGLWYVVMKLENYQEDVKAISNSKGACDGKSCYCTNVSCNTVDDLNKHYTGYFE